MDRTIPWKEVLSYLKTDNIYRQNTIANELLNEITNEMESNVTFTINKTPYSRITCSNNCEKYIDIEICPSECGLRTPAPRIPGIGRGKSSAKSEFIARQISPQAKLLYLWRVKSVGVEYATRTKAKGRNLAEKIDNTAREQYEHPPFQRGALLAFLRGQNLPLPAYLFPDEPDNTTAVLSRVKEVSGPWETSLHLADVREILAEIENEAATNIAQPQIPHQSSPEALDTVDHQDAAEDENTVTAWKTFSQKVSQARTAPHTQWSAKQRKQADAAVNKFVNGMTNRETAEASSFSPVNHREDQGRKQADQGLRVLGLLEQKPKGGMPRSVQNEMRSKNDLPLR